MKKIVILIPVYNDWDSLLKLFNEINLQANNLKEVQFRCVVINDASNIDKPIIKVPTNIDSIEIIDMKNNIGHARCNAFGVRYLSKLDNFDFLIVMDGDGEDRPEEIKTLIDKAANNSQLSVVAKRIKRSEGPIFRLLYEAHKLITFLFTGKKINFGNYSCLTKKDVNRLSCKASLWSSFSGTFKKYISEYNEIDSLRGKRYFGPSKMSLLKLILHSFSIIAVFRNIVFLRSAVVIVASSFTINYLGNYLVVFQILLVLFNLLIFFVSLRENAKNFDKLFNSKNKSLIITQ
mgnify:CR=1 FL=1